MSDTQQAGLSDGPRGIAGWLILPPILLVLMILAGAFQLLTFNALAEAASGLPTPKIYLLSVIVVLSVALAIICPILLLVVLFRKMRRFPRLFLLWAAAYIAFVVVNHFMVVVVFSDVLGDAWAVRFSPEALRSLALAVLPVAVFIPYILKSRRVQNTFVN